MSASEDAGGIKMVDLITSGDENDEASDSFELISSLKAGKSGAAASEAQDNFSRDLQGKFSGISFMCGVGSREERGQIETAESGS